MRYLSTAACVAAGSLLAHAAPIGRRDITQNEILVLQFADVLNQLEMQFYQAGMSKFQESDFASAGFAGSSLVTEQYNVIMGDESAHIKALEGVLASVGSKPVASQCKFNFDGLMKDVNTMSSAARVVENLGVAAFLGAANLISSPLLLTSAASILTVEARHQTVLNILQGGTSAIPQAFDIPLLPSEVLAIAGPLISGCDLGVPANPSLAITNTGVIGEGTQLAFSAATLNDTNSGTAHCQMLMGGSPFSISLPLGQCVVPAGMNGPVAIFITADEQPLAGNIQDRSTNNGKLLAGPTLLFVDATAEALTGMSRRPAPDSKAKPPTVTQTISPEQASSIMAAGGAQPTGAAGGAAPAPQAGSQNINLRTGPAPMGQVDVRGWASVPKGSLPSA